MTSILEKLGLASQSTRTSDEGSAEIERHLADLGDTRARFVAAFAGLLARVAYADEDISAEELAQIERLVIEEAGVDPAEARVVCEIAKSGILRGNEQHVLTRHFREVASAEERRRLVECLYVAACADDLVAFVEDREVRRIADALLVPWSEVREIRSRYREKLEEMQELRRVRERSR